MGVIKGICISEKRGTAKQEIEEAVFVKDWGIEKDAHAGHWHRQVSLLSYEKIEEFRKNNKNFMIDKISYWNYKYDKISKGISKAREIESFILNLISEQ